MARDHARLDLHIWTDADFRDLSAVAKLLYLQLVSQPKLSYAGVLDLAVKRWSRAHPDLDVAAVRAALAELDSKRFVHVDQDTEEVLVRTYIRNDQLYKQPNVLRAALRSAFQIESPMLRSALAEELRRLPVETGPAPAVAAGELEAGAHELTPAVMAAMNTRTTRKPATGPPPRREPVTNPTANPSGTPSTKDRGEGSRERETGVSPLASSETKVGDPAPVPAHTGARPRPREDEPAGDHAQDAGRESGSARQARRVEAERLVTVHCPAQPQRVVAALRGQVIGLLREGIEPAVIAAGLRVWAGKSLPPTWLPELVGELMRARRVPGDSAFRQRDLARELATAQTFEQIRADAVAEDDRSPLGLAVRGQLPAHADAATLQQLLDQALAATVGTATGKDAEEERVMEVAA